VAVRSLSPLLQNLCMALAQGKHTRRPGHPLYSLANLHANCCWYMIISCLPYGVSVGLSICCRIAHACAVWHPSQVPPRWQARGFEFLLCASGLGPCSRCEQLMHLTCAQPACLLACPCPAVAAAPLAYTAVRGPCGGSHRPSSHPAGLRAQPNNTGGTTTLCVRLPHVLGATGSGSQNAAGEQPQVRRRQVCRHAGRCT
jgi:hypothetical protein